MKLATLLVPLLFVLPLQAADQLPREVQKVIEQRDTCEHFRGEIPDPEDLTERMREVVFRSNNIAEARTKGWPLSRRNTGVALPFSDVSRNTNRALSQKTRLL